MRFYDLTQILKPFILSAMCFAFAVLGEREWRWPLFAVGAFCLAVGIDCERERRKPENREAKAIVDRLLGRK